MNGTPFEIQKLVQYIKANGPVSAKEAAHACGYAGVKDIARKLHAFATAHGQIESFDAKWQRVSARGTSRYIPPNRPLVGYNLWSQAMRPGCRDLLSVPSRMS